MPKDIGDDVAGKPVKFAPAPRGGKRDEKLFTIRYTGEAFRDESYAPLPLHNIKIQYYFRITFS